MMQEKANLDLRQLMKESGVYFWQLGERWGCNEVTVSRRFRMELPEDKKAEVRRIVQEITEERRRAV